MNESLKASQSAGAEIRRLPTPQKSVQPAPHTLPQPVNDTQRVETARDGSTDWRPAPPESRGEPPTGGWGKRVFDIVIASSALIMLAPLLLLVALAIKLESKGPAIFRQERGGFGGKTFMIWKFRTMTVTENRGVVQARKGDARVTRFGGFLRRSSWDELPQLVNVLKGDMSIIGPRPHAVEHDAMFAQVDGRYPVRFRARPGVTGLAQVSGCRGPTETDDKIRARTAYDAQYVWTWSWWGDVKILFKTVAVLIWKPDPGAL